GVDQAGQGVVSAALQLGVDLTGGAPARALVVGAGAMGALSLATLRRAGTEELYVTNRTHERAARLAANYGATTVPYADLAATLAEVDVVVCATASPDIVL